MVFVLVTPENVIIGNISVALKNSSNLKRLQWGRSQSRLRKFYGFVYRNLAAIKDKCGHLGEFCCIICDFVAANYVSLSLKKYSDIATVLMEEWSFKLH